MSEQQKILIVDDKKENLFALEKTLSETNALIVKASSGNEALSVSLNHDFALAILDVQMPDMNGYELAEYLRTDDKTRHLPIIFLTAALVQETDIFKGYESGGVDYFLKPYNPAILLSKVAVFLELDRQKSELLEKQRLLEASNKQLATARDRAEESDRLKSTFLAVMSHELRTPLNSIIGFTGIVLQGLAGPLSEEQTRQLGMVQDSATHLHNLINDVLDISRIEAGEIDIEPEAFDVLEAFENVVQKSIPSAEQKGLALTIEVAPEVDRIVSDRRRVEQILINLVNNAVKFTEHGEVRIECCLSEDRLVTRVKDSGIGINPGDLDKLFIAFQQLDTGLNRKQEGTGLGLSICKKLVALLGGELWVESKPGAGSVFTFTLPMKTAE